MPSKQAFAEVLSAGAAVAKSDELKAFAQRVKGNEHARVSIPVQAATMSVNIPAGVVEPQRLPGIDAKPRQRLFIRDLIAPGRATSPAIFWVQMTGFTNAAGRCLVMQTKIAGKPVAFVVLDAFGKLTHMADANRLKRWIETGQVTPVAPAALAYKQQRLAERAAP